MNAVFILCAAASAVWALTHGTAETLGAELMQAGSSVVQLSLTLAGGYMIWCGLMEVLRACGAAERIADRLQGPVRFLLGKEAEDVQVRQAVCLNFTANLLGLGNAATPAGLRAMQCMAERARGGVPTHGMCMFLLLNASSLQILPTTVFTLRAAYGAAHPADILLPTLAGSAAATLTAVVLGLLCRRRCA